MQTLGFAPHGSQSIFRVGNKRQGCRDRSPASVSCSISKLTAVLPSRDVVTSTGGSPAKRKESTSMFSLPFVVRLQEIVCSPNPVGLYLL